MDSLERLTDEQLARAMKEGQQISEAKAAFEELYNRLVGQAAGLARQRGAIPPDDEVIANQAMFKLWQQISRRQMELDRPILPWLMIVVANLCIDLHRTRRGHQQLDEAVHPLAIHTVLQADLNENVFKTLGQLNPRYSDALQRRHVHSQSISQIAQDLELEVNAVYRLLDNARGAFKATWISLGFGNDFEVK